MESEWNYDGADAIERAWREGLTPDPLLTVSEWADRHRMLSSKASAEPGRWSTRRTPYLKEIMDCLSPMSPVERVVFMKGVQLGATECGNCWIGYVIHHAPGPMMAVSPTVEMAKRNSKQRIDPLIEESPVLRELIAPARSRDAGNTILAKEFRGGVLVMTGANSAVGLRSMPVRYLFLDEVDGYPSDVDGEGDAISLAEARTWIEEGEAPDWQQLLARREDYKIGTIPKGGLLLVGGADVQRDRIEASIWAFGRDKESWLVEHRVLMGDTAREAVWKRLAEMIAETWTHESGCQVPLARFALDTGFATQEAYTFVRAVKDSRVMAVKGVARGAALVGTPTAVDATVSGKKLRRGIKLFTVVGAIAKLEFYNNLRKSPEITEDGTTACYPPGYVHLPKIDAEFLQQLCAEQLVTRRDRNGYAVREWQKMRERNEALDIVVYSRAAASASGLDRFEERHWRELEKQLGVARLPEALPDPVMTQPEATPSGGLVVSATQKSTRRIIKSRWIG